jgi:hypothetical protein
MMGLNSLDTYVSKQALAQLNQYYTITASAVMLEFDQDFDQFREWLLQHSQTQYAPQEKILIVHFDTDYYLHNGYGVNINNLFEAWYRCGVPVSAMILYTNHLGIAQEVESICQQLGVQDRPVVIETLSTEFHHSQYRNTVFSVDDIDTHAVCLMAGVPRSHRYALFNHVQSLVPEKIILTINRADANT